MSVFQLEELTIDGAVNATLVILENSGYIPGISGTGFTGPTGPQGLQGINGISGGLILFMDIDSQTTTPPVQSGTLDLIAKTSSQTTITANVDRTNDLNLCNFSTNSNELNSQIIPTGLWDINLYAYANNTGRVYYYSKIYYNDSID